VQYKFKSIFSNFEDYIVLVKLFFYHEAHEELEEKYFKIFVFFVPFVVNHLRLSAVA